MFSIITECESIITERQNWEGLELAASNKRLYSILQRCYAVYRATTLTNDGREALSKAAEHLNISVTPMTHSAIKVIKIVFGDEPRWRASVYGQVLRIADANGVNQSKFAEWLENAGGVDKVRRGNGSPKVTEAEKEKLFNAGLAKLKSQGEVATLPPTRSITNVSGLYLMLCSVEVNGSIKVHRAVGNPNSDQVKAIVRAIAKEKDNAASRKDPDGIGPNQFLSAEADATKRTPGPFSSSDDSTSYSDAVERLIGSVTVAENGASSAAA
jgi:hypothetical protein